MLDIVRNTSLAARWVLLVVLTVPLAQVCAETSAAAFARMPSFTDLAVSPGGKYFAARFNSGNRYRVSVFEITESGVRFVYGFQEEDTLSIDWFKWVSQDHLVASAAYTAFRRGRDIVRTSEKRLVSLNATTAEATALFRHKKGRFPIQIQDNVVSFLPQDPEHILVQYRKKYAGAPDVYRVDVTKMAIHQRVMRGRSGIGEWMTDASGEIRLGIGVKYQKNPYLIIREKGKLKWQDFTHRVANTGLTFRPLGFSEEPNKIYVASNHEGDPSGLYLFDIEIDEFGPLLFKHPRVDISSVRLDENTGGLLSVKFVVDDVATKRFGEQAIQQKIDKIRDQFPDQTLSTYAVASDGNHAVLRLTGERDAGNVMIYHGTTNRIISLPPQYPELADDDLGKTFTAEYVARDGLVIPAFVTLPPQYESLDAASELPFVIHPHGGPGSRDFLRFSFDVQFMASLGYGVLQMNFRGSTGYGQAFKEAGHREWGQAMQDDITDGVKWLVENKLADAGRIAIVGGSYGGYAALMGVVKTPDLYRCAASFAGVTDLPDLLQYQRNFIGGKYRTRFIGDLWRDRKMLAENSPARRAHEIEVPVLLMHGDRDTVVAIEQSQKMASELRDNGKEYSFVEFKNGDHHLSLYQNRLRYLQEMETFLGKCLQ